MLPSAAVSRMQSILGFRGDLVTACRAALAEAQVDLENGGLGYLPWFLRSARLWELSADDVDGLRTVALSLPQTFLRADETMPQNFWETAETVQGKPRRVTYVSRDGKPLGLPSPASLMSGTYYAFVPPETSDEMPAPAELQGQIIRVGHNGALYTNTDISYTLLYYARDEAPVYADPAAQIMEQTTKWLTYGSELVIGLAGRKIAGIRDRVALDTFNEMEMRGRDAMMRANIAYSSYMPYRPEQ